MLRSRTIVNKLNHDKYFEKLKTNCKFWDKCRNSNKTEAVYIVYYRINRCPKYSTGSFWFCNLKKQHKKQTGFLNNAGTIFSRPSERTAGWKPTLKLAGLGHIGMNLSRPTEQSARGEEGQTTPILGSPEREATVKRDFKVLVGTRRRDFSAKKGPAWHLQPVHSFYFLSRKEREGEKNQMCESQWSWQADSPPPTPPLPLPLSAKPGNSRRGVQLSSPPTTPGLRVDTLTLLRLLLLRLSSFSFLIFSLLTFPRQWPVWSQPRKVEERSSTPAEQWGGSNPLRVHCVVRPATVSCSGRLWWQRAPG